MAARRSLQYVNIPDSVTEINYYSFFVDCKNIQAAYYKGKTYDYEHIGWLYDAVNLGESGMLIENGVLKDVSRELTELIIPDSVTAIGDEAFKGCTKLIKISIPNSVTKSGRNTFDDLTNMSVTYKGNTYTYAQSEELYIAINEQEVATDLAMPNLIGMTVNEANITYSQNFNIVVEEEWSEYPEGQIFEQEIPMGRIIRRGSSVTVTVSKGVKQIEIPDLTNKTESTARAQLEKDGFKVSIVRDSSNDIVKGYVIRTTPAAHELAGQGSTVTLVVSMGASASDIVTVPNLVGLMLDEAIKRCEEYHLLAKWNIKSDSAKKGTVIGQSIPANNLAARDEEIILTVSEGTE